MGIVSKNNFKHYPNCILINVQPVKRENLQKLTYRDAHCFLWKVAQVALAVFVTLATLCISLCFLKGRQLWINALDRFKDRIVFEKRITNTSPSTDTPPVHQPVAIVESPKQASAIPVKIAPTSIATPNVTSQVSVQIVLPIVPPAKPTNINHALQLKKDEILNENPDWQIAVKEWKGISLEDQIWVLQLFELRKLGLEVPFLNSLMSSANKGDIVDRSNIERILSRKIKIEAGLASILDLNLQQKKLRSCPDAICLLPNLKSVALYRNALTTPPDLSKCTALKILSLQGNQLTTPPDLSKNTALLMLSIDQNQLTTPPDLSKNSALTDLNLADNNLTTLPNLSANAALEVVDLTGNPLDESSRKQLDQLKLTRPNLKIRY